MYLNEGEAFLADFVRTVEKKHRDVFKFFKPPYTKFVCTQLKRNIEMYLNRFYAITYTSKIYKLKRNIESKRLIS